MHFNARHALATGLVLVSTAAGAADLPSRRAPPVYAPPPPIPVFSWNGFYIGGNAGYAFDGRGQNSYNLANGSVANSGGTNGTLDLAGRNRNGFTGGGQIGFNYVLGSSGFGGLPVLGSLPVLGQLGSGIGSGVLLGLEADAQYLGLGRNGGNNGYTFNPAVPGGTGVAFVPVPGAPRANVVVNSRRSDYFGTVRGRLGVTFDRFLAFGSGGFAYSNNATGYAVGGGVEYALTNNVTLRGEYLYVDLGRNRGNSTAVFDAASNTVTLAGNSGRERFNVVRGALNYKFDTFAPAPVVARY